MIKGVFDILKKILAFVLGFLFIFTGLALSGCGEINDNDNNETGDLMTTYFDTTLPDGVISFDNFIMNLIDFDRIIPLGQINPPGHTFPTDHIYFVLNGSVKPVYAPTGGKILNIGEPNSYGDCGIRIGVTSTMSYYLDHIFVDDSLKVGDTVVSGVQLGTSGNTPSIDFGVINKDINNGFLSQKYPVVTLYGDKPISYYIEPLRAQLYAEVVPPQPVGEPDYVYDEPVTDGKFVFDEAGTLLGNWFLEGCFNSNGWYEWTDTFAFGYDCYYPEQIRIGSGQYSNPFAIKNDDLPTKPENVSTNSGAVAYYLYNANNTNKGIPTGTRTGLMMVQMLTDTRIQVEIFDDTTSTSREFTSSSLYYVR